LLNERNEKKILQKQTIHTFVNLYVQVNAFLTSSSYDKTCS
jgi:hypothetical protein